MRSVDPGPVGRGDAREGRTAGDHLEQARLLAEEVAVGAGDALDGDPLRPAGLVELGDGRIHAPALLAGGALHADDDPGRSDDVGGHEGSLEDLVRVPAQQGAVLERPRLALGGVHHDGDGASRRLCHDRRPLARGREAGAASSPQPGRVDSLDHRGGLGRTRSLQRPTATGPLVGRERADGTHVEDPMDLRHRRLLPAGAHRQTLTAGCSAATG